MDDAANKLLSAAFTASPEVTSEVSTESASSAACNSAFGDS